MVWLFADKFVSFVADIHSDTTLCVNNFHRSKVQRGELHVWEEEIREQKRSAWFALFSWCCHYRFGWDTCAVPTRKKSSEDVGAIFMECIRLLPSWRSGSIAFAPWCETVGCFINILFFLPTRRREKSLIQRWLELLKMIRLFVTFPACGEGYWMVVYQSEKFWYQRFVFKAVLPGIYYVEKGLGGLNKIIISL